MESMIRKQLFFLGVLLGLVWIGGAGRLHAQALKPMDPALSQSLREVYDYWRNAMVSKNYREWKLITATHRQTAIQNRILSSRGRFPQDVFNLPGSPPSLEGLKLLRARSRGVTAKLVFFGKVDFGVGGEPTDNLWVTSYVYEGKGWKYDSAEFVSLSALKDVRKQLKSGQLDYVDGEAFLPDGKRPVKQVAVGQAKYIAKVYTYCPGREVRVTVNKISRHQFQNDTASEVVIGGARDGMNQIRFWIKDLPGYQGDDPITVRVYLFSQIEGVKPIKVYQYQTAKGEKPKLTGSAMFNVGADEVRHIMGQ